jgi:hypothetical protein
MRRSVAVLALNMLVVNLMCTQKLNLLHHNAESQEAVGTSLSGLVQVYTSSALVKQQEAKANIALLKQWAVLTSRKEWHGFKIAERELQIKEHSQALEMLQLDKEEVCQFGLNLLKKFMDSDSKDKRDEGLEPASSDEEFGTCK